MNKQKKCEFTKEGIYYPVRTDSTTEIYIHVGDIASELDENLDAKRCVYVEGRLDALNKFGFVQ